jgi:hypothetical protein
MVAAMVAGMAAGMAVSKVDQMAVRMEYHWAER